MTLLDIRRRGEFKCNVSHLNALCRKVNDHPGEVYRLISEYGGQADTVTREAIFTYVADKYHRGNYSRVYDKWLAHAV